LKRYYPLPQKVGTFAPKGTTLSAKRYYLFSGTLKQLTVSHLQDRLVERILGGVERLFLGKYNNGILKKY